MAGINIVGVPYKGVAPAINALLAGEVQMIIGDPGLLMPHVKSAGPAI
jgi:tripartite-type tricarboxylate transporter receptor subunit TctC